jgi:predicted transport protein
LSDIKLFRIGDTVGELAGSSVALDKALQSLIERNLETFLGVRFLASEYSIGKARPGRVATLGIDENNSPVIIEYKRSSNENVINQGLFYLDWLIDHRGEFMLLAMKRIGTDVQGTIDWSSPRLICIAGDYTKYDEHAVAQIDRTIELVRYRTYGDEFLVLELVNGAASTPDTLQVDDAVTEAKPKSKTVSEYLEQSPAKLRNLFQSTEDFIVTLGDDVTRKITHTYIAFRRIKNFACIEIHPEAKHVLVYVKVDPANVTLEAGFTRDVRAIDHLGTGDLEITITDLSDLQRAKSLIVAGYEAG